MKTRTNFTVQSTGDTLRAMSVQFKGAPRVQGATTGPRNIVKRRNISKFTVAGTAHR